MSEAVAASSERTLRTGFVLRTVNAIFVRAADDLVDGDRGFDMVFFEEGGDGFGDFAAVADGDNRLVIAAF